MSDVPDPRSVSNVGRVLAGRRRGIFDRLTIVVDTRTSLHRVQMGSEHNHVLFVATLGLSKDVLSNACLDSLDNLGKSLDLLAGVNTSLECLARLLID